MRSRIALSLLVLGFAGHAAGEVPLTIGNPESEVPFWVDVRVAVLPDGTFDPRYFGDPASPYEGTVDEIAKAVGESVTVDKSIVDYIDARLCADFDCAVRSAELIVRGTVSARTFGFQGREPGQVLEIRPSRVLEGEWGGDTLFIFYPVATFCAAGKTILKTDDRWPDPPAVGDQVFLLAGRKPSENHWVQAESDADVVVVRPDSSLAFGERGSLRGTEIRTASELEGMIQGVAGAREQKLKHALGPDGMPYLLYGSGGIEPEWVDARIALGDDGRLDRTLFPERFRTTAESAIGVSAVPGSTFGIGWMDPDPAFIKPEATLDQAADQASLVILARVKSRAFGFWQGIAGQLLRLGIERTFRGVPALDEAYLFLPQGDFEVGPFRIVKTDDRYPDPPEVGAEVFLLTYPNVHDYLFFPLEGRGFVPVDSDGLLVLGSDYRAAEATSDRPIRTKNDLIERILEGNSRAADTDSVTR